MSLRATVYFVKLSQLNWLKIFHLSVVTGWFEIPMTCKIKLLVV